MVWPHPGGRNVPEVHKNNRRAGAVTAPAPSLPRLYFWVMFLPSWGFTPCSTQARSSFHAVPSSAGEK